MDSRRASESESKPSCPDDMGGGNMLGMEESE